MGWFGNSGTQDAVAQIAAINKSQAIIEFAMDGTIITANPRFLDAMGYTLDDIRGKHHEVFVPAMARCGDDYNEFWPRLNRGEVQEGEYKCVGNHGRVVWMQCTYNPVLDAKGKPLKVVKFSTDVTAAKIRTMEDSGKMSAISRAQAVIEFELDGTIITANENFLTVMGYTLAEITGKHHRMFVEPATAGSAAYREFWASLNRGEYQAAEYKRIGKGGKDVWILASYIPILDDTGKPFKVVKFATDVSDQKLQAANFSGQIDAIGKSQAVIEFNMDGTIVTANANFLGALGYALPDIKGRHHSMFVVATERDSSAYRDFWANLNRGEYQAGEYKRIGNGGKEIWIQASYNPILDLNGKPFKVVKYATDVTAQVIARMKNEHVCGMLDSVAAGAEELNASVREIASSTSRSSELAIDAVKQVDAADNQVQRLNVAAQAMGGIVQLIGDITGQINLLALNATIESARAGEAGRGFAVVASEVKSLANQAKQATDRISGEINALNDISSEVVDALKRVKEVIETVGGFVTGTAAAIEEQSAVTGEMSSSMQRAAAEAANIGQAA